MKALLFNLLIMLPVPLLAQQVGIGTNAPQATLHINGTVIIDSLFFDNTSTYVIVWGTDGQLYVREFDFLTADQFTCGDVFADPRDGQMYPTTQIGSQCWMAKNLNYTFEGVAGFYYDNDSAQYAEIYGLMYTWHAIMQESSPSDAVPSGVQGICPPGWHIPSQQEWEILRTLGIGGRSNGGHLKDRGTLWDSPNVGATNLTQFNAVPGGNANGGSQNCLHMGEHVEFWSTTEVGLGVANSWHLDYRDSNLDELSNQKNYGLYCRCVRD